MVKIRKTFILAKFHLLKSKFSSILLELVRGDGIESTPVISWWSFNVECLWLCSVPLST